MIAFKTVSIVVNGRAYNGTYLRDLGQLNVGSAYGSKTVKLTQGQNADAVAKALLAEIVGSRKP